MNYTNSVNVIIINVINVNVHKIKRAGNTINSINQTMQMI